MKKTLSEQIEALKKREAGIKAKIRQERKDIPKDIGKYICDNFKVKYTTKSGKKAYRPLKDKEDFKKHFQVVKKGSDNVQATIVHKDNDKKSDKDKSKDKKDKNKGFNNNQFNNDRF